MPEGFSLDLQQVTSSSGINFLEGTEETSVVSLWLRTEEFFAIGLLQRVFSLTCILQLEGRGSFSCFTTGWRGSFSQSSTTTPGGIFPCSPTVTKRVFSSIVRLEERGSFPHFLTSIPEGFFSGSTTGTERIRPVFRLSANKFKFRDLAVEIPSSTLAISWTFPTGLLLLRMISTNQ